MRSINQAILWETWRVARTEGLLRLALCVVGGLIALISFAALSTTAVDPTKTRESGAVIAMVIIVMPNWLGWIFLARLNKGRAGYPMPLLYTRPVTTVRLVGLQMVFLTSISTAIYLVSAVLMKLASGYPFPFLSVAVWIATSTVMMTSIYWSSRSVLFQQFVGGFISGGWLLYAITRLNLPDGRDWNDSVTLWPTAFHLTLTDWVICGLIAVASFGMSVYSISRQRRGDARAAWTPGSGWPSWIVNLFHVPCPTSSATRAQIWFDLKSRGLPVLSLGLMLAILNPLLFALSNRVDAAHPDWSIPVGPMAMLFSMMSFGAVLVIGGVNAFGIRWRAGGTYFEATQPYSSARLAGLKVIVRSTCLIAALIAVGGTTWAYLSHFPLLTGDKLFWKMTGMAHIVFLKGAESAFGSLAIHEKLSLLVIAFAAVFVWVASFAVILPLWFRYPRRGNIAAAVLLAGGLALSVLALAGSLGLVPAFLVDAVFATTRWLAAAAALLATIYLFWNAFAERLLTPGYALGAAMITAVLGLACLAVLQLAGLQMTDISVTNAASMLSLLLVPLLAIVLVPWSLSRFRHL